MNGLRLSSDEYNTLLAKRAPARKFKNEPTVIDGEKFDSKREALHYNNLRIRQRAGEVRNIVTKPSYCVIPATEVDGQRIRATYFSPDFEYEERIGDEWIRRIDDVKFTTGANKEAAKKLRETAAYKIFQMKRKLLLQQIGVWVRSV